MLLLLYIITIILGLICRKSKTVTLLMLSVMYIISAFRTYDADYNTYLIGYNLLGNSSNYRYAGYTWFQRLFYNAGATFEQYNKVFSIIIIILMLSGIAMLTKTVNPVLSCYLVFSFPLDVVQMKTALANAMALVGIALVLTMNQPLEDRDRLLPKERRIRLLGLTILILSCFIHFSSVYYLLAIAVTQLFRNRRGVAIHMFVLLTVVYILLYSGFLVILLRYAGILNVIGDIDYIGRWTTRATRFGFLVYLIPILITIYLCPRHGSQEGTVDSIQNEIAIFQITSLLLIPLLMVNGQYSRLIRIYILMTYIYKSRSISSKNILEERITLQSIANSLLLLSAIGILFYFNILLNYDMVLGALVSYNALLP